MPHTVLDTATEPGSEGVRWDAPPVHLTRRERQIIELVLEGCSNVQAAERLGLRVQTIKNHLVTVYRKFGIASRAELIHTLRRPQG